MATASLSKTMKPNKFFPSSVVLPPRKYNLGDSVQYSFDDGVTDDRYYQQGVIFGYQYQHKDFGLTGDVIVSRPGWVYCVIWFYESGDSDCTACPYASHTHEDDLELIDESNNVIPFTPQLPVLQRATRYQALLKGMGEKAVAVTLHDTNEGKGFVHLDVYARLPQRLNKPKQVLIGQPVTVTDSPIAEPRMHYIKRALANGQVERYSYTYADTNVWRFNVTVMPIFGTEEVITVVEDAEDWQLGYWNSRVTD
ncbi:MAG: hypothetical protein WBB28_23160 [Crinalium sp.]